MAYAIINIGSNLGDRRMNLSRAVRAITNRYGNFEVSHTVETEPFGFESDRKFLNMCLMVQTDETPLEMLHALQEIEKSISDGSHRDAEGRYCDRVIDIDLIAMDDQTVESEELTLPHKGLEERVFFLKPLAEVAPGWVNPRNGLTADQMLAKL